MTCSYFVTGTDTDVGKTYCTSLLLQAAKEQGISCLPYKPIAAGCEFICDPELKGELKFELKGELKNDDALTLIAASDCHLAYSKINPYALALAIAPHIAAAQAGITLDLERIQQGYNTLIKEQADLLLIEGAGGWLLPLELSPTKRVFFSDWVIAQQLPVIVVVGMKLGCLNHAQLTMAAITSAGLTVAGWIANQLDPTMAVYQENLESLMALIDAPLLAEVPYGGNDPSLLSEAVSLLTQQTKA